MSLLKTSLTGLKADSFRHPLDLEATKTLKQIPGLDMMVRNLLGPMAEQVFYVENIASSILVGEKQLPDLHKLLLEACQILDIDPPQLYVRQHPAPNAYTFAMRGKQPFVVIHTSLIEILTPEEIQAVIAHELGHLKCDHSVYLTPVNLLILAAAIVPNVGAVLAQAIQSQLLEWVRCAEFTCDRAALLATQNPKVVMSVLMKLAGGSPSLAPQLNLDAFVDQARAYDDISKTELGEMVKSARTAQLSHPVPVLRAREIDRWASSQEYQKLVQNHGINYKSESASPGGWRNW
ncbi:M48 family metallopeptidase [Dolichospermum sp. LEGE 00240]|jgi:Zn-dependent protease with chaperone function|uniref:M48 family metallopeptidase n=1 Tax=Dolichospermum sp. LEGE 00240 TaxID=1828603 RepID=UPI001880633B|nr:M48 family metallopeptidase [Dolichospermum sp. LEGE 00240]MDM3847524.1 M48 family metallopeptidase [Aphanizomenon gracile PMC638.10]MDM3850529.1 M48 family metallopeptidase [Aphanizomenon gracile PMC627.10]MDM3854108.1 M48 family metallopeptidase [Aphanizomenon gracile PMC649.10]MDM3862658.1 M48 family metallopeptidase [Aphanizomenon gracile PMC644.10]MBE9251606.1 M48 family metallopeptidase [Dolichospermum sp. LEGE 00240]